MSKNARFFQFLTENLESLSFMCVYGNLLLTVLPLPQPVRRSSQDSSIIKNGWHCGAGALQKLKRLSYSHLSLVTGLEEREETFQI
jgi:hypothetical protein